MSECGSAALRDLLVALTRVEVSSDAAEMVDQLDVLERVKAAAAGAQVRISVALRDALIEHDAKAGVPVENRGRGAGAVIAFARRISPSRGSRDITTARALVEDLPRTYAALAAGAISEWRATLVARETAVLKPELRSAADEEIGARLTGLGDRRIQAEARAATYRLDPEAVVRRNRTAERERRVTLRPAPDTMAWLSAIVPVAQGVAMRVALERTAKAKRAQGDERTNDQLMADTLVERVTGQATADGVPVEVQIAIADSALFNGDERPASLAGYGPIPAELARRIAAGGTDAPTKARARAWVRRLYTDPEGGTVTRMDRRRRVFAGSMRDLIVVRDQACRTPYCDAPVRHIDNPVPVRGGGATTLRNSQGLCEACNYRKEDPGWRSVVVSDGDKSPHAVRTRLPTGHAYTSTAPPLVDTRRSRRDGISGCSTGGKHRSRVDIRIRDRQYLIARPQHRVAADRQ